MFSLPELNLSLSNNEMPVRVNNVDTKKFHNKVFEEFQRDNVLADVFLRSTQENPYKRHVSNSIELCQSLKEEARQRFLEEKRRQQLRENNHELKQLSSQLRAAYINRGISLQLYERDALKKQEQEKEEELNRQLNLAHLRREEIIKYDEQKKRNKCAAFKAGLQSQLEFSKYKRQVQYEALLKEKQELDDLIRKNKEEELKEQQEAIDRSNKTKLEMEKWKRDEEAFKAAQAQANQEEDDRILKFIEARDQEIERANEEKRKQRIRQQEISERIGQTLYEKQMKKIKAQDNLTELLVDEFQAKLDAQNRQRLEKELQKRIAAHQQLAHEMDQKELRKLAEKKIEEDYFKEEMCILAERDKLEQLNTELRQKKKLEHRKALQKAFDDKKRLKAENTNLYLSLHQKDLKEDEKVRQFVEEERVRMIMEHAPALAGFWKPGFLRASDQYLVDAPPNK